MLSPYDDFYRMLPGGMQSRVPGGVPPSSPVGPMVGPPMAAFPGVAAAVPGGGGVPGSSPSSPGGGGGSGSKMPGLRAFGGLAGAGREGGYPVASLSGGSGTIGGVGEGGGFVYSPVTDLGAFSPLEELEPARSGEVSLSPQSGDLDFGPPAGPLPPPRGGWPQPVAPTGPDTGMPLELDPQYLRCHYYAQDSEPIPEWRDAGAYTGYRMKFSYGPRVSPTQIVPWANFKKDTLISVMVQLVRRTWQEKWTYRLRSYTVRPRPPLCKEKEGHPVAETDTGITRWKPASEGGEVVIHQRAYTKHLGYIPDAKALNKWLTDWLGPIARNWERENPNTNTGWFSSTRGEDSVPPLERRHSTWGER